MEEIIRSQIESINVHATDAQYRSDRIKRNMAIVGINNVEATRVEKNLDYVSEECSTCLNYAEILDDFVSYYDNKKGKVA